MSSVKDSSTTSQSGGRGRYRTERERWRAVSTRDARADGRFVYCVRTTGVYCRPSCASRLARRDHVLFHDTCEAAERAGFRPCKRCQPNGPSLADLHASAVARACELIRSVDTLPDLSQLATAAGMSRFHFHRVFTRMMGLTPRAFGRAQRAERARKELANGRTVTESLYRAGYNSSGRFYAEARSNLGMLPKRFRDGGKGLRIEYAVRPCALGQVLVAASSSGICAIALGDASKWLVDELRTQFPHAELTRGNESFERVVGKVVRLVETPGTDVRLPLDLQGTAFQRRVWKALQAIPPGQTASYSEIARRIGFPRAVRAVAGACAANKIAVAIPCHRAVRSDGSLSGYRWGRERKRALLDRESASVRARNRRSSSRS